jgi:hypothetical protein
MVCCMNASTYQTGEAALARLLDRDFIKTHVEAV